MTLGLKPLVGIRPALLIARKAEPALIPAAANQLSTAALTPGCDGYGPDVATLPNEIRDYPVLFSLLEMFHGQSGQFRSSRPHPRRTATMA
jgi:hypothetical protein